MTVLLIVAAALAALLLLAALLVWRLAGLLADALNDHEYLISGEKPYRRRFY